MKRILFMAFMLSFVFHCFANEFELDNIPTTHYGIWIPQKFDVEFKTNCNYIKAIDSNRSTKAHDILIVSKNRIQSDLGFHDGYAIRKSEFRTFLLTMDGSDPKLIDNNKNEYILISTAIDNYYMTFVDYLIAEIGKKLKKYNSEKAIYVKENKFYIRSRVPEHGPFKLIPDLFFMYRYGIDTNDYNFLVVDEKKGSFYGVFLDKDSVEIDEFVEKRELIGNAIRRHSVEIVRVFSMK